MSKRVPTADFATSIYVLTLMGDLKHPSPHAGSIVISYRTFLLHIRRVVLFGHLADFGVTYSWRAR